MSPWYVTGFVDGEGAFTYCRSNWIAYPRFSIRQRFDYSETVRSISEFLEAGTVYDCKAHKQSQASSYLSVTRKSDLLKVVNHFDKFPVYSPRKQTAYALWKEMVLLWTAAHGSTKIRLIKSQLDALAIRLSRVNVRPRGKP